ncbi:LysM peptidoglycan-binding domain-containing protein [Beijerinckia mobilis]|uniref:LysM peptidoglycan-binding domain-containing protein n=1 Tax=Beijerinckia mobilis TaxID=231434 RepID=UPI0005594061|nr:LysM peptidoglycan-binding domain-containing protein [Beijerinckia mobilis]
MPGSPVDRENPRDGGLAQRAILMALLFCLAFIAYGAILLWGPMPAVVERPVARRELPAELPPLPDLPPRAPPQAKPPTILVPRPEVQGRLPQFDIVRLEPSGALLVAGRAAAGSAVALIDQGHEGEEKLAAGTADSAGMFVFEGVDLKPGVYALSLSMRPKDAEQVYSGQNVAIFLPASGQGEAMVALVEAGKPTQILRAPKSLENKSSAIPVGQPGQHLSFTMTEIVAGSGIFVSGRADPMAQVQLYLNDTLLTRVTAAKDGSWSLRIREGLMPGTYRLRADAVNESGGVVERAEVALDIPRDASSSAKASADTLPSPSESAAVVEKVETTRVEAGDSLWRISMKRFGNGFHYMRLYSANSTQIRDPEKIYPGQILVLPQAPSPPAAQAPDKVKPAR